MRQTLVHTCIMNRIITAFILLANILASCSSKYQIEGESSISYLDGKMLFLRQMHDGQLNSIDSAEVVHGYFNMKGNIDSTQMAMLFMDEMAIMPVVLERGNIHIVINNTEIRAKGTPMNDSLYCFFDRKNQIDRRIENLRRKEAQMILNGEDAEDIHKKMTEEGQAINADMKHLVKSFITQNSDNILGPGVFLLICQSASPAMMPQIEEILAEAPESLKNNPAIKDFFTQSQWAPE